MQSRVIILGIVVWTILTLVSAVWAEVTKGVISMTRASWPTWGGVARDAISRLEDVDQDSVKVDAEKDMIIFMEGQIKNLLMEKYSKSE